MTIHYKWSPLLGINVPILHSVKYADTVDDTEAQYQYSLLDHQVNDWLRDHCKGNYYHSPGWMKEKFIQFEDDRDALLFTLKWGK